MKKWLAAAIAARAIDPFELWPIMSREELKSALAPAVKDHRTDPERSRLWERIATFALKSVHNSYKLFASGGMPEQKQRTDILFFANSRNNLDSLYPIYDQMQRENQCLFVVNDEIARLHQLSYAIAVPYLPFLLLQTAKKKGYCRESIRWGFDVYWQNYGLYFLMRLWLQKLSPKVVFVANDHSNMPCVLTKAASDLGMSTCYVQHASVTENFPPLKFDYAFLDGIDAARKYATAESRTSGSTSRTRSCAVYVVGLSKFDGLMANGSERAQSVGICASPVDDYRKIEELLLHLRQLHPDLELIFRPHLAIPKASKMRLRSFAIDNSIDYSDGNVEKPTEFLSRVDVIVSGSSGILLEAALMDVTPLNYNTNQDLLDYYGFVANGLCPMTSALGELSSWIDDLIAFRPSVKIKAKQYCETIDTPFEGKSALLIASVVASIDDSLIAEDCGVSWTAVSVAENSEAFQPKLVIKAN